MTHWPNRRVLDLFGIDLPILQAPMAGFSTPQMTIAVSEARGLGALACSQLSVEPEARISALTNLFTGRPARGIVNRLMRDLGPVSPLAPRFPLAAGALAPLKAKAEQTGSGDFTNLWSGQAARLAREMPAGELTRRLAAEALAKLARMPGSGS